MQNYGACAYKTIQRRNYENKSISNNYKNVIKHRGLYLSGLQTRNCKSTVK